jgi:hypothetical protein
MAYPQTVLYAELLCKVLFHIYICGRFIGIFLNQLFRQYPGVWPAGLNLTRVEPVIDIVESEIHLKVIIDIVFQVILYIEVLDSRIPPESHEVEIQPIVVIGVDEGEVGEQFIGKEMVPSEIDHTVAIRIFKAIRYSKYIPAKIAGKENIVLFIDPVIEFGIEVKKVSRIVNIE